MDIEKNHSHETVLKNRQNIYKRKCKEIRTSPNLTSDEQQMYRFYNSNSTYAKLMYIPNKAFHVLEHTYDLSANLPDDHPAKNNDIAICVSPKTGTTNWHRLFIAMFSHNPSLKIDQVSQVYKLGETFKILSKFDVGNSSPSTRRMLAQKLFGKEKNKIENENENSFNFNLINVRHPLARLQSAWHDKFTVWPNDPMHNSRIAKHFQDIYWKNAIKYDKLEWIVDPKLQKVSFNGFLNYIVNGPGLTSDYNYHWAPIYEICAPCHIDYDMISKLETVESDAEYLLTNKFSRSDIGSFLGRYQTSALRSSDSEEENYIDKLKNLYSSVPKEIIKKLINIYKNDFEIFGYDFLPFLEFPEK